MKEAKKAATEEKTEEAETDVMIEEAAAINAVPESQEVKELKTEAQEKNKI